MDNRTHTMANTTDEKQNRWSRLKIFFKINKKPKLNSWKNKYWKPIRDELDEFCSTTSIHGLRHVFVENVHYIERIFWLAIVISLVAFAVNLGLTQVNRYLYNPIVVSIKKDYRSWITKFPAITICLTNKMDKQLAKEYIEKTWRVSEGDEKFSYYEDFLKLVVSVSFRSTIRQFWRFSNDTSIQSLDLMAVAIAVGSPLNVRSILHNKNHKVIWEPIMTEMGMCYTFNSVFSRYQSMETWRLQQKNKKSFSSLTNEDQLLTCNYMNKQCYARFNIINSTGKYFIHSPFEVAEITSNPTEVISADEELDIEFHTLYISAGHAVKPLAVGQRRCKYPEEHISRTIPAYSNALCQIECRSRMALVFCGCRPYFFLVGEGKDCDLDGMCCIARNMEVLINLPTNLAKCSCIPQCTEINYMPFTKRTSRWNSTDTSLFDKKSSAKFSLQMPKVMMHKDLIFTFADLVASFGGTGALFLGISFLSIVEIFLCVCKIIGNTGKNIKCRCKRKNVNEIEHNDNYIHTYRVSNTGIVRSQRF